MPGEEELGKRSDLLPGTLFVSVAIKAERAMRTGSADIPLRRSSQGMTPDIR